MAAVNSATGNFNLTLDGEERKALQHVVEAALRNKSIEANRTDAIEYHEFVHHEEEIYQRLLNKLQGK